MARKTNKDRSEKFELSFPNVLVLVIILQGKRKQKAPRRTRKGRSMEVVSFPVKPPGSGAKARKIEFSESGENENVLVLRASGKFESRLFFGELKRAFERNRKIFLLNLQNVEFWDLGEAVGNLVGFYKECDQRGVKLAICNIDNRLMDKLKVMKLVSVFACFPTEEEALNSLK